MHCPLLKDDKEETGLLVRRTMSSSINLPLTDTNIYILLQPSDHHIGNDLQSFPLKEGKGTKMGVFLSTLRHFF